MKLTLIAALAALAVSFEPLRSVLASQDPPKDSGTGAAPRKWPWGTEDEAERIRTGLQGAWRLVSVRRAPAFYDGDSCQGFMLITSEHLSMQSRVLAPTEALRGAYVEGFSAGTYKWAYDLARLKMVIHTAMAVSNFSGENDWEPQGLQREYDVLLNEDLLTLTRPGEAEFSYVRVRVASKPPAKTAR